VTLIDPTDSSDGLGGWRFDPDGPEHAGWRERYAAFDTMYRPRLLRFVRTVADQKHLAEAEQSPEAVVQVALTRIALNWPHVAAMDNPRGYVYTIAANLVRTAAAHRAQARARTALLAGWTSAAVPRAAVATEAADRVDAEAAERVEDQVLDLLEPGAGHRALAGLPLDKRMATYLFDVERYSAAEIAEILDCTPTRVYALTRAGRRFLRVNLAGPRHNSTVAVAGLLVTAATIAIAVAMFGRQIIERVRGIPAPIHHLADLLQLLSLLTAALPLMNLVERFGQFKKKVKKKKSRTLPQRRSRIRRTPRR
jgi:DNA-directed RNA polymerase specialized sigma24 family protein